jgi:hypothetical protein
VTDVLAYRLRVDLDGFKPPIWRRLVVPATFTFGDLHRVIQEVFEWREEHLHDFQVGDVRIGPFSAEDEMFVMFPVEDEDGCRLVDMGFEENDRFRYLYDHGDDWQHTIRVEEVITAPAREPLPRVVAGRRRGPEEDSAFSAEAEMFAGDPAAFDLTEIDARLERIRSWWRDEGAASRAALLPPAERVQRLLLTKTQSSTCDACAHPMTTARATLGLGSKDEATVPIDVEMMHCASCAVHQVSFETLAVAMDGQPSVSPSSRFTHDGRPVLVAVAPDVSGAANDHVTLDEARQILAALPAGDEHWEIAVRPVDWIQDDGALPRLGYLTAVFCSSDLVRTFKVTQGEPPSVPEAWSLFAMAASRPMVGCDPGRPGVLHMDGSLYGRDSFVEAAELLGLATAERPTPTAVEALATMEAGRDTEDLVPWLHQESPEQIEAFLDAFADLMDANPALHLEPEAWVGVVVGDGPPRPACLLGINGDDFGYLLFDDEDDAKRFRAFSEVEPHMSDVDAIAAIGMESVSLHDPWVLHPEDAALMQQDHGLDIDGRIPLPMRLEAQGFVRPRLPLAHHILLLRAFTKLVDADLRECGGRETILDGIRVSVAVPHLV